MHMMGGGANTAVSNAEGAVQQGLGAEEMRRLIRDSDCVIAGYDSSTAQPTSMNDEVIKRA